MSPQPFLLHLQPLGLEWNARLRGGGGWCGIETNAGCALSTLLSFPNVALFRDDEEDGDEAEGLLLVMLKMKMEERRGRVGGRVLVVPLPLSAAAPA